MVVRALQCVRLLLSSGRVNAKGLTPLTRHNVNLAQSSWLGKSPFLGLWHRQIRVGVTQRYCSTSGGDRDDETDEVEGEASDDIGVDLVAPPITTEGTVAPISIPEVFPDVPVLTMNRNPLFPRFVKMMEVREPFQCKHVTFSPLPSLLWSLVGHGQGTYGPHSLQSQIGPAIRWCILKAGG